MIPIWMAICGLGLVVIGLLLMAREQAEINQRIAEILARLSREDRDDG
jgi:hypothetical protein